MDESEVTGVQQCYQLYAPGGKVGSAERLAFILRSLNLKPTIDEARKYFATYKKEDGVITLEDFIKIVNSHLKLEDPEMEILEAFKTLDPKGTGKVDEREIRRILTKTGENLTNSQVDQVLKYAKVTRDNKIEYKDFVRNLLRSMNY